MSNCGHFTKSASFRMYVLTSYKPVYFLPLFLLICSACHEEMPDPTQIRMNLIEGKAKEVINKRIEQGLNQSIIIGMLSRNGYDIYANGSLSAIDQDKVPDQFSLYEIGSITKIFTGLLLALKVSQGEIKLMDEIGDHLPDTFEFDSQIRQITWLQLATHTSGLSRIPENLHGSTYNPMNPWAHYTEKHLLAELVNSKLVEERFQYSNTGMGLLGYLLTDQQDSSYFQTLDSRILKPLGMVTTSRFLLGENIATPYTYALEMDSWDFNSTAGAGELKSTIYDMLKFLSAQLGFKTAGLASALTLTQHPYIVLDTVRSVGLAWGIYKTSDGDTILRHNGGTGGFRSFMGINTVDKIGVVVFSNSSQTGVDDLGLYHLHESYDLDATLQTSIAYVVSNLIERMGTPISLNEIDTTNLNNNWEELNQLGYSYIKQKQINKAINVFQVNVLLHPKLAEAYDSLGEGWYLAGRYTEALDAYLKAIALAPDYESPRRMIERLRHEINF